MTIMTMKMSMRIRRSMFAMAAFVISVSAIASAQYTFVKFKVPMTGSKFTAPQAISNKNEIVGTFEVSQLGRLVTLGFWRSNDHPAQWTYLQDPSGDGHFTQANSINSSRVVVGDYTTSSTVIDGMVFSGGQYSTYDVSGCKRTYIDGINDHGDRTGDCLKSGTYRGWLNRSKNGVTTFFTVPGAVNTYTTSVNSIDEVGGWYFDGAHNHGYERVSSGGVTTIDFPGAVSTWVFGISDITSTGKGWVSGTFEEADGSFHGYLYSVGKFTQIEVPGSVTTSVTGVNKHGWFVGSYTDSQGHSFGFYAKPSSSSSVVVDEE